MAVLPLLQLLLLALGTVVAAPELREENAVLPPAPTAPPPGPGLRAAPLADVQAMMMEAVSCSPQDEERALRRQFLTNASVTCNDGSPAGFYVRRSAGSRRWVVLLEGGWYCHDTRSCHHRWQRLRHLMTSRLWPEQRNVGGILSPVPEENPYSWNANHVLVPYCSSDSWSGSSPAPTPGETFSFMGALIVQEVVRDLAAHGWLSNDSHVLLAGTSAGGTGVMLNVDAVQELVRALGLPRVSVRGLVDSGWFLDRPPFSPVPGRALTAAGALRQGMALWRARVPAPCAARHRTDPWRCYFGYRLYPTVKAPLFLFQWLFDEAQMTADNVGAPVSKQQWDFIHEMGDSFRTTFSNVSAVFAPACIAHTVLTKRDWAAVRVGRVSLPSALRCWDNRLSADSPMDHSERKRGGGRKHKKGEGGSRVTCPTRHVEMCSWPQCNHSCPKLHNPFTGEEMNFIAVLKSFGLDMLSVANALGIDIHTLNNMDPEELLQLLTAS